MFGDLFARVYLNKEVKIQIQMDFYLFDQFLPDFPMVSGLNTVHYYNVFRFIYDIYQLISTGFLAALTLSHIAVWIKTCSYHQKNKKKPNISQAFHVSPSPRHSSFVISLFQFSCDLSVLYCASYSYCRLTRSTNSCHARWRIMITIGVILLKYAHLLLKFL